jgi:hypothetical protein
MGGGAGSVDPSMFEAYTWDGATRYLLFRYFDTNVEPGKRYVYRVRMALADVNFDPVPKMYLANEVVERLSKTELGYRMTDWSAPSPVAVVPQAGLVYLAGAEPANQTNVSSEPEAEILIKTLDAGTAAEAALAQMFTRGSVLNLLSQQAKVLWSMTFQAVNREEEPQPSPEFDFRTGLTLLDFEGGEVLNGNRKLLAPARAVLMDSAGRLSIKNELDDLKPVTEYDGYVAASAQAAREQKERESGRGDRGGYGPPGGGYGRGRD